ncbi:MAG: DUF87 domain-containing protein, partial [Candidatus Diapherotrites archaeon]|nr:DUF87 domain-containing protein [Candidatus Diapherotrites archaeon]
MQEEIGTVISSMNGPSPSEIEFVVTKGAVHRGQFVELDYSEGTMVCLVTNVLKTNRYFERADSVKEFEVSGRKVAEQFPTSEWEYLMGQTRPLGVFAVDAATGKETIKRPSFPPSPGTRVRIAHNELLERFLGFDTENGLMLGTVENHALPVRLNLSQLLRKHIAILAQSGFGKSVSVKTLIEEILSRHPEQGRLAVIVIDPHGEYTNFAIPNPHDAVDFSHCTRVISGSDVRIGVPHLDVGLIGQMVAGLSIPQQRELRRVLDA